MKKIISLLLSIACIFSVAALGISAAYVPMTPAEMTDELSEKENAGMALGWGFDDIKTETNEYVKDAYVEAAALAKLGKHTMTEKSADEVAALAVSGLVSVAVLEKKTGGEAITLYKFSDNDTAAAYASALAEKNAGSDPEVYVRACGATVAEGDKSLVYKVGVAVVDGSVLNGDFVSSTTEGIESEFYQGFKDSAQSGMQFKNLDSAIVCRNGEIVISKAEKDYYVTEGSYAGYKSVDAYMDIYASGFSYNELHDIHGGDAFVLSARMRAPYSYGGQTVSGTMNIFVPRCAFNVKVNGVQKKLTIDQTVLQYNVATREVYLLDAGVKVSTGIFLSDYEYTTIAAHIDPATNTFDFYADGMLIYEDAQFLTDANLANLHSDPYADPTGLGSDYTLTRVRLFYINYKSLTGDLVCIDDFAWYFSDEYLEASEENDSVVARSVSVGDKLYLNFYLNLNRATLFDYSNFVTITVGEKKVEIMAMTGEHVEGGELDGLVKFSVGVDSTELDEPVAVKLTSQKNRDLYFYTGTDKGFRGVKEYTTTVKDCLTYIIDNSAYSDEARALARAALNYGAYAECYYAGIKFGYGDLINLPNEGYEYTDEFEAITPELVKSAVESEKYREYTSLGEVPLLAIVKNTVSFDDGIYITVTYRYEGMKKLTVNGEEATGEYRINVNGPDALNSVYTVVFVDGTNCLRLKISPFHLAANMMSADGAPDYTVNFIKALYIYNTSLEAYFETLGEE